MGQYSSGLSTSARLLNEASPIKSDKLTRADLGSINGVGGTKKSNIGLIDVDNDDDTDISGEYGYVGDLNEKYQAHKARASAQIKEIAAELQS